MSYTTYLAHHGIKGQKWGVRRFQNPDGSLTSDGRHRQRLRRRIVSRDKTNPEINDLVRAMTDEDKARIGLDKGQEYTNHDESVNIAHRSVLRRGKKIVAFCDAFMVEADLGQYGKNPLYVAIGTSAERQNRGKGYATIVAKQMQKWFDSQDEFDVVVWSAKKDNVASRKIAEKLNFKYIPESASDTWVDYAYSKKREVSHALIVNDDIYSYRSYLAHHGIKGQKWGVRRFQKADGSLTAAGAKRYGIKGAMSAGRKVGAGLVKAARGGIQKAKEAKARKAAEKLERQKKVWAKTRLGLTMNADKFTVEELREANNRLDERDRAARGLAEQVKRGVGYFQAIRDVTGAIRDTKDYIEDISGEKGKKAKAADELKYQRELEKEKRTYERDMVRDKVKADQEYEYKREKDKLDRESKEKIEKMKAKAKKKKDSGGSDTDPEPDETPKKKASRENTTEFEDVYWNSSKKDREFMKTVFPKEVDEAKERKKRRNKARREVDEAIRRMGFFGHSDISTYGAYLAHHGIKGQKWGVRRFQNEDGTLTKAGLRRQDKAEKFRSKELERYNKNINRATERGQKSTKQMYEKLAKHLVKMTVDDIYKEHRAVRTQAIGKAVLAGTATALASSFAGLPNIASIPIGVAMGKAASAGTRDQYRLRQIAHTVIFADDNALEHHGIKGQKWGVRRFQDEAGRLTSAGKKHAAALRDKVTSKLKITAKSIDFEPQGGGGGGTIDGWEDVSEEDEQTLNDQKTSMLVLLKKAMFSEDEVHELAEAFGYEFDDSLSLKSNVKELYKTIEDTKGSDLKTAMFDYQQIQRKKVSYSDGITNGVSAVVNALFSSNLAAVADPVIFVKDVISAEMAKSKAEKRKQGEPVDEETGLHLKQNTDASREEDLKDVNPGWKNLATNTKHNCMCCTATYDMRRRGYDVTANEVQFGYDYGDVTRWYPDAKVKAIDTTKIDKKLSFNNPSPYTTAQYKKDLNEQLQKELVAQGDGARGNLMVKWDGGGGHSMAYEVVDGVAYIYDGQANMKMDTSNVVAMAHDIQYARLDNVDFDPEKIKEVVH